MLLFTPNGRPCFKSGRTFLFRAVLLLCAAAPLSAQSERPSLQAVEHPWNFGLYAGYANNTLYQGGAEDSRPGKIWQSGDGWTIGLPVRFQIFNWLGVQVEPTFITKNYGYSLLFLGTDYANETTNSFVDFPVMANFSLPLGLGGLRLFANAGFFLGYWVASHEKGKNIPLDQTMSDPLGTYYEYDEDYQFDDRRDSRFDGGLVAGAGLEYRFRRFSVFTEWRLNYSLSDLQKPYMKHDFPPQMNDTWTLHLGILINPGAILGGNR
jgi:hypothetical protein